MSTKTVVANLDAPDAVLLDRVLKFQKASLGVPVFLALPTLLAWALPPVRGWLPAAATMSVNAALVSLMCAVALALSLTPVERGLRRLSRWVSGAAIALTVSIFIASSGGGRAISQLLSLADHPAICPGEMTVQFAAAFVLLAILLLLMDANDGVASHVADLAAAGLSLLVLFLSSRYMFEATHLFGTPLSDPTPAATVVALAFLSLIALLLRVPYGACEVLMVGGVSGRIARIIAVAVIVLPFMRETTRERLIRVHVIPEHGAAAFLSSVSAVIGVILLVIVTRYIRRMEKDIRHLTLQDELTGLYNLRGFKLLAEQALRMAQRSHIPFSVLFIDLDDLKQINDSLGHQIGSDFLVETAELLKESFRETDVLGRIGGDEFAVAGQFTQAAIAEAGNRLAIQASLSANESRHGVPLGLSMGHVTASGNPTETLEQLLAKADAVMYDQKRRKKLQVC